MRPVGIGETLRRSLAKLVMRASRDQTKTACGNLQLYSGLEAGIEGATHTVGQRRLDRLRERSRKEEAGSVEGGEDTVSVDGLLINLSIETAGTEEEAADKLKAALGMEVKDKGEG